MNRVLGPKRSRATARRQLREVQPIELHYVLLIRVECEWRRLIIPRASLAKVRDDDLARDRKGSRGRKPKSDSDSASDDLTLTVEMNARSVRGWNADLTCYLDTWPPDLPEVQLGPGTRAKRSTVTSAAGVRAR
jgi:hypothetical protein